MKSRCYCLKIFLSFFLALSSYAYSSEKVVIWGHKKPHCHTHHYVHAAFFKAFKHMGYDVHWFDPDSNIDSFDFSNCLFITEGQVDERIPVRNDCRYVLHNCEPTKYKTILKKNKIKLQVYTDDVLTRKGCEKIKTCIYYDINEYTLYFPWAAELLPFEIDILKDKELQKVKKRRTVYWVGTIWGGEYGNINEISSFKEECKLNNIMFRQVQGVSELRAKRYVMSSILAPTVVGTWQKRKGYIPCRIFKNLSYGQLGLTNSERTCELFENKIVYRDNAGDLVKAGLERLSSLTIEDIHETMDMVRDHHTYVNRINQIYDFFSKTQHLRD